MMMRFHLESEILQLLNESKKSIDEWNVEQLMIDFLIHSVNQVGKKMNKIKNFEFLELLLLTTKETFSYLDNVVVSKSSARLNTKR